MRGGLEVSGHLDNDAINRVLLITDGQANVGEVRVDRIVAQAGELAAKGVSTSTIGIGRDFNEDLLMPMAEAGQGNAWHVQEPQDMVRIFDTELQGLVMQIGHNVTFGIKTGEGITVAEVLNDFETDGSGRYKLPNLKANSPLDIVVRLRVPPHETGRNGNLAEFSLAYISQDSKTTETLQVEFAGVFDLTEAVALLPENGEVTKAVQLLMNARARREAMDQMDRRDYTGAQASLKKVSDSTDLLFSVMPSREVEEELEKLDRLSQSLDNRDNDMLARKQMAYQRESIRKGK